jgi:hypothetical protein
LGKYRGSFRLNFALRHPRPRIKSGVGSCAASAIATPIHGWGTWPGHPGSIGREQRVDGPALVMTAGSSSAWDDSLQCPSTVRAPTQKHPPSGRTGSGPNTRTGERRTSRRLATPSGGAETGPCLTDAAPEAAPDRAVREKAATPKPERVPRRSWRQSAPVVPCPSPQLAGRIGAAADALPPLGAAPTA